MLDRIEIDYFYYLQRLPCKVNEEYIFSWRFFPLVVSGDLRCNTDIRNASEQNPTIHWAKVV